VIAQRKRSTLILILKKSAAAMTKSTHMMRKSMLIHIKRAKASATANQRNRERRLAASYYSTNWLRGGENYGKCN